jgi:Na+/proline symporter
MIIGMDLPHVISHFVALQWIAFGAIYPVIVFVLKRKGG